MTTTTTTAAERRLSPALLVGGTFALTTLLGIAVHVAEILFTDHDPKAPDGAIVLGPLAIITLPFFWSGAPATLGAGAAWLGGLVRGSHQQTGAAHGFGIVGLVIAVMVIIATVVGGAAASLFESATQS